MKSGELLARDNKSVSKQEDTITPVNLNGISREGMRIEKKSKD